MRRARITLVTVATLVASLAVPMLVATSAGATSAVGNTLRLSLTTIGNQADDSSSAPDVSGNGLLVAFATKATNLADGDTSTTQDVHLRPLAGNQTTLVSINTTGPTGGNAASGSPSVNGDGTQVAFQSAATDLIASDVNAKTDVFVRSLTAGTTQRLSFNGEADGDSTGPDISGTGRYVAFTSDATNLVPGDTNGNRDVFVTDRGPTLTGPLTLVRISVTTGGTQGNGDSFSASISANGRYVVFTSDATNFTPDDPNDASDVFLRDRDTDADSTFDEPGQVSTVAVSLDNGGLETNGASFSPSVSDSGRYVVFGSDSPGLVTGDTNNWGDVFLRDVTSKTTTLVSKAADASPANSKSDAPVISGNAAFVAYRSWASNIVATDTNAVRDIFLWERATAKTDRVSMTDAEAQADGKSNGPSVSTIADAVAFSSGATNLVTGDTNALDDAFVRVLDRTGPTLPSNPVWAGHTTASYYADNTPTVTWAAATDGAGSGVAGYSRVWDHSPTTTPDTTKDTSATSYTTAKLADASNWYVHVRAVDNSGNWGAARHAGPFHITATSTLTVARFSTSTSVPVTWTAAHTVVGATWDLRVRHVTSSTGFSGYSTTKSATASKSTNFAGSQGVEYCFGVRDRDSAGGIGDWSADKCTMVPDNDNTALLYSPGWTRTTSASGYYFSDYHSATAKNEYLRYGTTFYAHHVGLLVTTCSTCGAIQLQFAVSGHGVVYSTKSLVSSTTKLRQVVTMDVSAMLHDPSHTFAGTFVAVITTTGKPVKVDGWYFSPLA